MAANTTMSEYAYCECLLEFQKDIKKELAQTGIHAEKLMEKARKKQIYTQEKPGSARGSSNPESIISLLVSNCIENVKQNPLLFDKFLQFLEDVGLQQLVTRIRCKFQELSDKKHKTSLDSNTYTDSGINVPSGPSQANSEPLPPLQGSSEIVTSGWSSKDSNQKGSRATTFFGALQTPNQSGDGPREKENPQSSLPTVSSGVSLIQPMEETQDNVTGYVPALNSMPRLLPADNKDIKKLTLDRNQAKACHYEEAEKKKEAAEKENEEMKAKIKLQQPLTYRVNKAPFVPVGEAQEDEAKELVSPAKGLVSPAARQSITRNTISNQDPLHGAREPETVNTELKTEIQELREDKELLTKEIQEKNEKINVLEAEKKHIENELEGRKEEIRELKAKKGLRVKEFESFKAKTAELERKLQQKDDENKEQKKQFSEQEKEIRLQYEKKKMT